MVVSWQPAGDARQLPALGEGQLRRRLERNLSGIDDPKVLRRIQWRCLWEGRSYGRVLTVGIPVAVALCAAVDTLTTHLPWFADRARAFWLLGGAAAGAVVALYVRRAFKKAIPQVLRSMRRCESCGYSLAGSTAERCPECGEPIRTESNTAK